MITIVDVVLGLLFFLVFVGSYNEGLVKNLFSLVSSVAGFYFASLSYSLLTGVLSPLPGTNWDYFAAFFIMAIVFNIVLTLLFWPARALYERNYEPSFTSNLAGGLVGAVDLAIGLEIFSLVIKEYPVHSLLERIVIESEIFRGLANNFGFLEALIGNFLG